MKTEYRRDMGKNYMVFQEIPEVEEGYFLKLIQSGQVEGLLPLEVRVVDGKKECLFDVTGKQALKTVFERSGIDKGQLEVVLQKIQRRMKTGEEYLLKSEDFVLTPESIFLDLSDFSIFLCYLPGYQKRMEDKWKEFTEYLMSIADDRKEETILYVYRLYKAAREPDGFIEVLRELSEMEEGFGKPDRFGKMESFEKPEGAGKSERFEKSDFLGKQERFENLERREGTEEAEGFWQRERRSYSRIPEFEERIEEDETVEEYPLKIYILTAVTVLAGVLAAAAGLFLWRPGAVQAGAYLFILGAVCIYVVSRLFSPEHKEPRVKHQVEFVPVEEENSDFEEENENTVILASAGEKNCFLRAEDSVRYQDIELIEYPFFFGKLRTQVNSRIESPAVSRFHAKIEHLGEEYYLVDLNSTNGTFLNGERLKGQERRKLAPMDRIRFADVGYYFEADGTKDIK